MKADSAEQLRAFLKDVIRGDVDVPDNAVVILNPRILSDIFTKKRMELIEAIDQLQPQSIQELAAATKRKKQAVHRDLNILEGHRIIELRKEGRCVVPVLKKQAILLPLRRNVLKQVT